MRSLTEIARNIKDTDEPPEIIRGLNYFFFSLEDGFKVVV